MTTPQRSPDDPQLADEAHRWKSAYVHIPFCRRRCPYCDFAIVDESTRSVDHHRYVEAVIAEMAMEHAFPPLDAVNFGGGTPSLLDPDDLGRIIDGLRRRFGLGAGAEVSMEVNPEDWTIERGEAWAHAGVTRISVGAQSMDDQILGVLGRLHHREMVQRVVGEAGALFGSVSVDLMFGHPAESDRSWRRSVESVLALDVDHISTYALTVEGGTELAREVAAGAPAPDDDAQADRYEVFTELSQAAGFARYEVSNHARAGHVCRYNLSTWAHGEYLGFGMAAHDHRWGRRSRNHRRVDRYLEAVEAGRRPRLGSEVLSADEQERDRLMLGLRLAAGAPMTPAAQRFVDSREGVRLLAAGAMIERAGRLVVTDPMLADAVAREALSVTATDC